ncbi:chloride channel protein [Flavobacterium sp. LHD-80]|uniref:chloride channel protein n=1 Tax=Flavobacterium sp. LHD-80 TaxID=3071411 RepID=UPI0027E1BC3F|nr:chloride channel protein [Flavobacterium sp. LHD-80]MDQ6470595.1 chloride channel protein [Flavobacterium sp. LHD-80]
MERHKIIHRNYFKLILISIFVGLCGALLAFSLKKLTEFFEHCLFNIASNYSVAIILFPTIGITAIYFLRKYAFKNRKNKGITEIYKTLDQRKDHLPLFKIPSHYINGFLTVIFGGSTGIEVSTVVATATIGNFAYKKNLSAKIYKRELICAGVTAGVAILFCSPLAGWLFAMEVIARKISKTLVIACTSSALVSWLFISLFDNKPLLLYTIADWNWTAFPFFIILSLFAAVLAVYFTLLVTRIKGLFGAISNNFIRVNLGALIVGVLIYFYPGLYGDSYDALREVLHESATTPNVSFFFLLIITMLKPLAASLTLGAGGDGGVFAPSIVCGAFLGLLVAFIGNNYFGANLIPLNFALVGAAAALSASLFAPFTSLVLICNLLPNGYLLFVPILFGSVISYFFSKKLLPYNVYSYDFYLAAK